MKKTHNEKIDLAFQLFNQNKLAETKNVLLALMDENIIDAHDEVLHLFGIVLYRENDFEGSIKKISEAITLSPEKSLFHSNLAEIYRAQGNLNKSIFHGEKAIELNPNFSQNFSNLGIAYYDNNELELAEKSQIKALKLNPNNTHALNNLGSIFFKKNLPDQSEVFFKKAISLDTNNAEYRGNLINVLISSNRENEAIAEGFKALERFKDSVLFFNHIGRALSKIEQFDRAIEIYKNTLRVDPNNLEALLAVASNLTEINQCDESEIYCNKLFELKDFRAETYTLKGKIKNDQGFHEDAKEYFLEAIRLNPTYMPAYINFGHILIERGRLDEAKQIFLDALKINDQDLSARLALTNLNRTKDKDENFLFLLEKSKEQKNMLGVDAIHIHFALGKSYEDIKDFDSAFNHFNLGCEKKRKTINYDANNTNQIALNIKKIITKDFVEKFKHIGNKSQLPIFVLGMPRSGTTLVETILDSHSQIFGAGELNHIIRICGMRDGKDSGYPASLLDIAGEDLKSMADNYIEQLIKISPNASRIVDKMPANFFYLGLIYTLFPNAKIIHVMRDPIDTCFSNFKHLFHKGQLHSYTLEETAKFYLDYLVIMEHWRNILPKNAFYEMQYENLVENPEQISKDLLRFCGLEWEENCINFHTSNRKVKTASVLQVRQPIYKTSMKKWQDFEKHLQPLIEILGQLNIDA
jgi:tetratricopeptide (TPR) repeat protein